MAEEATVVILGRQKRGAEQGPWTRVGGSRIERVARWYDWAPWSGWRRQCPGGSSGWGDGGEAHRSAASKVVAGRRKWSLMEGGEMGERKGVELPSTPHPHPQGLANFSQASPHAEATGYWPYLRAT